METSKLEKLLDTDLEAYHGKVSMNKFCDQLMLFSKELGTRLIPLGFGYELGEGVVDLYSIEAYESKPLWYTILEYYRYMFDYNFDETNFTEIKSIMVDYFLRSNICYVETVSVKTQKVYGTEGRFSTVSAKTLATKNEYIIAKYLGSTPSLVVGTYTKNLDTSVEDIQIGEVPYIKIDNKNGKIIKCNKSLQTENVRVVPVAMIVEWLKGLKSITDEKLVKITYYKDDDSVREITTTTNLGILEKFYGHSFALSMLEGCITGEDNGHCLYSPFQANMDRGWFRVPEVGSSKIDDTGVRAINFARIISLEVVEEDSIDTRFMNVSLNSVSEAFLRRVEKLQEYGDLQIVSKLYVMLQRSFKCSDLKFPVNSLGGLNEIIFALRGFIENNKYSGTPFRRELHLFMIDNIDIFPDYVGQDIDVSKHMNFGIDEMDF